MQALGLSNGNLVISGLFLALAIVALPFIIKGFLARSEWLKIHEAAKSGDDIDRQKYKMAWMVLAVEKNKVFRWSYIVLLMFSIANILLPYGLPLESTHSIIKDKTFLGASIFMMLALLIPVTFIITNLIESKKENARLADIKAKLGVTGKLTLKMINDLADKQLKS